MENLTNSLKHLCQSNPEAAIWYSGDINLPDIDWETLSICSYQYLKAINESFLDLLDIAGLEQMVDFPTREENTLDVFVTNRPSLTNKCCPLPALSDHTMVFMEVNIQANRRKPPRRKILLWKRADIDSIRKRAHQVSVDFTTKYNTSTPVEDRAEALQLELAQIIDDCVSSKMSSTRANQPWFNSDTKRILRRKSRAFKKARRTNNTKHWARFKRLKKEARKVCRYTCNKHVRDIINSESANGRNKKLGALVKSKRRDQTGIAPLKDGGFLHTDPKAKANILNRQFSSDNGTPLPDPGPSKHPSMDSICVNKNGVIKLFRKPEASFCLRA